VSGPIVDLSGLRFGNLIALRYAGSSIGNRRGSTWECLCSCGNIKNIHGDNLRTSRSCGCKNVEAFVARISARKSHGMSNTRTHNIWLGMRKRCSNHNAKGAMYYAHRGITVCDEWQSFQAFLRDMGEAPDGMSIDRIDGDKGYFKANCRWATATQQARNTRSKHGGIRGVHWHNAAKKWQAVIRSDGINRSLGFYEEHADAVLARANAERLFWEKTNAS
jgi:hypothetical protein